MTHPDRTRLRSLAEKYAEYATGRPMAERREKWRRHNRLQEKAFPVHIEDNGAFFKDLTPPLQCVEDEARWLEGRLLHALTAYEMINDDRIIPDRFLVDWVTPMTEICDELEIIRADNGRGSRLGYRTSHPIKDIAADWGKLKHREIWLDRERTEQRAELAREAFAGLLPVEVGRPYSLYSNGITNKAVHLMGMQELYLQMAIDPDAVHRLLGFLAEDNLALGRWEEEQGLLTLNNDGNQGYCTGTSLYSDETNVRAGERVMASDQWGYTESQESAGLSPRMFEEFVFPHLARFAEKFKLLKHGCCEPVHNTMPVLNRLHGLRKVSVTPWCDMSKLTESCPPEVIWCRKPIPLKLCGQSFSLEEMRQHLQETLDIGQDYFIEFVYRDTNMLTGAMVDRVAQTCDLIREMTGHPEGSRPVRQ